MQSWIRCSVKLCVSNDCIKQPNCFSTIRHLMYQQYMMPNPVHHAVASTLLEILCVPVQPA